MQTRVRKGPPKQAFTADEYARARAAYLEHGTQAAVASALRCQHARAARLIDSGEPALNLPSLRDAARAYAATFKAPSSHLAKTTAATEAEELARTLEARAKAAKAARKTEEVVLGDAQKSRADEVRLVRANRMSALVLASVNADLLKVSTGLARSLLDDEPALRKLSPEKRLNILRTVAGIVQRTADASRISVNMERLLMGEPTTILGREGASTQDMTADEAEEWLAIANRAFARRASRRVPIEATGEPLDLLGDDEPAGGEQDL